MTQDIYHAFTFSCLKPLADLCISEALISFPSNVTRIGSVTINDDDAFHGQRARIEVMNEFE